MGISEQAEKAKNTTPTPLYRTRLTDVWDAMAREREYQDWKWGSLETYHHTVAEWLLILERELNEAKSDWVTKSGDMSALGEILQVIAVGAACLEQHGIVERVYPVYEVEF